MPEPMKTMTKANAEELLSSAAGFRWHNTAEALGKIITVLDFLIARTPEQEPASSLKDSCPVCGASDCDLGTGKTKGEQIAEKMVSGGYQTDGNPNSVYVSLPDVGDPLLMTQPQTCSGTVDLLRKYIAAAIDAALAAQRQEIKDRIGKLPGNTVASRDAVLAAIDATPTD